MSSRRIGEGKGWKVAVCDTECYIICHEQRSGVGAWRQPKIVEGPTWFGPFLFGAWKRAVFGGSSFLDLSGEMAASPLPSASHERCVAFLMHTQNSHLADSKNFTDKVRIFLVIPYKVL
jgi:hypothetical protein